LYQQAKIYQRNNNHEIYILSINHVYNKHRMDKYELLKCLFLTHNKTVWAIFLAIVASCLEQLVIFITCSLHTTKCNDENDNNNTYTFCRKQNWRQINNNKNNSAAIQH